MQYLNLFSNYWELFQQYKKKKMSNKAINNQINETIIKLANNLIYGSKKVLLYGLIQSGKTDFILGTIFRLFSLRNRNIIIYFSQPNSNLLKQNIDRFSNFKKLNIFTFKEINSNSFVNKLNNNENIIIFLLKNKHHLSLMNEIIKNNEEKLNNDYLLTIFDDEGDVTSFYDKNKKESSTIFNLIKKTIDSLNKNNYISVTATPYAHILVPKEHILNPEQIYFIQPGDKYTGLEYFINDYNNENKIFYEINNINNKYLEELKFNYDLKISIITFIFQNYLWKYHFNFSFFPRMIINIDNKKQSHSEIKTAINYIIERNQKDNFYNEIIKIGQKLFKHINFNINNICKEQIKELMNNLKIITFNGNSTLTFDNEENENPEIIIGSKKIDRGITFINLVNCFISYRSNIHPNADYILQQARFLGYRDNIKQIMKIFVTKELINDYIQINDFSLEFIEKIELSNNDFKKINKFIPLNDEYNLFPTRSSISDFYYTFSHENKVNFIKNKYYDNDEEFEKKFLEIKTIFDSYKGKEFFDNSENKVYFFENINDFSINFLKINNKITLENLLKKLIFIEEEYRVLKEIIDNQNLKLVVRLLKPNNRKIYKTFSGHYNIGQGNYSQNEKEFFYKKMITIDIIPIKIKNEEHNIDKEIYRLRLLFPNNINYDKKTGFTIDN